MRNVYSVAHRYYEQYRGRHRKSVVEECTPYCKQQSGKGANYLEIRAQRDFSILSALLYDRTHFFAHISQTNKRSLCPSNQLLPKTYKAARTFFYPRVRAAPQSVEKPPYFAQHPVFSSQKGYTQNVQVFVQKYQDKLNKSGLLVNANPGAPVAIRTGAPVSMHNSRLWFACIHKIPPRYLQTIIPNGSKKCKFRCLYYR